jgi:bacterioferritin-associated ferredoxin
MVVCICNSIREKDVLEAARAGAKTARCLFRHAGRKPKCAQCVRYAEELLSEANAVAA